MTIIQYAEGILNNGLEQETQEHSAKNSLNKTQGPRFNPQHCINRSEGTLLQS